MTDHPSPSPEALKLILDYGISVEDTYATAGNRRVRDKGFVALASYLVSLEADRARLDWIQEKGAAVYFCDEIAQAVNNLYPECFSVESDDTDCTTGRTIREAIDAAIQSSNSRGEVK